MKRDRMNQREAEDEIEREFEESAEIAEQRQIEIDKEGLSPAGYMRWMSTKRRFNLEYDGEYCSIHWNHFCGESPKEYRCRQLDKLKDEIHALKHTKNFPDAEVIIERLQMVVGYLNDICSESQIFITKKPPEKSSPINKVPEVRSPLTAFIHAELEAGRIDPKVAWKKLRNMANGETSYELMEERKFILLQKYISHKTTDFVEAIKFREIDDCYSETFSKYAFRDRFQRELKKRTNSK
jgi:hypothetical protein